MSADAPPIGSTDELRLAAVRTTPPPVPAPLWSGGIETRGLLKAALPAHRALAACAQALRRTPLDIAALDAFTLLDAVGAVQLEGEPMDPRAVLETPPHQLEPVVARQREALARAALDERPVDAALALELASVVAGRAVSLRRHGLVAGARPGFPDAPTASARPPPSSPVVPLPHEPERLQGRLERWEGFVQRDSGDLDPLLMCGVALAEWLAIRPFTTANVRVGQLLVQLLLVEEDLLPSATLPLSLHLSRHADTCWSALSEAGARADPEPWLRFFLGAVESSANDTLGRLEGWEDELAALPARLGRLLPKVPSEDFVRLCARAGFGLADVIETGLSRRQTAAAWVARLVEGGVLRELRAGKEKRLVNDAVVALLID